MTNKIKLSLIASLLTTSVAIANEDLGTITVSSATKSKQSIKDVTSNVDVITSVELEEKHITNVSDALNLVSGISFTSNGGLGSTTSVRVRGFDSKRVLVLIDGVRYNDLTGLSGAPFEHLMATDIAKIEIIKGAQSGIWGADASAGVINIITKTAKKGLHGEINAEVGSFHTKKYGAVASYGGDKFYTKVSSQRITSDGFTVQAPSGENIDQFEDDKYKNTTTTLKAGLKIDDTNKVDISHTIIDAKGDYDGGAWGDTAEQKANNGNYHNATHDTFSSINYENKNSFSATNIQYNKSKFDREFDANSVISEYDGEVNEYGLRTNIPYWDNSSFIIVGADYKSFEHKNSIDKKYNNKALFLTNNNKFNNTIITESIRVDHYNKFDNKTTGKVGVKHNFNQDLYLSINSGTAYNVPTLFNLYSKYGNENLKPETTKSYDISFGYKDLEITYFHNKVTDMIDYDSGISKYGNLEGTTTLKGYEIAYQKNILADTLLNLNYTRTDAKDKEGYQLQRVPKNNFKFGIDYYGVAKLHLGFNGEYVGKRVEYNYGTHDISAQTGKYTVMNFVVNYDITKTMKIYGKIDNITNKYYQTVDGYATSPRAYYAGIKVSF